MFPRIHGPRPSADGRNEAMVEIASNVFWPLSVYQRYGHQAHIVQVPRGFARAGPRAPACGRPWQRAEEPPARNRAMYCRGDNSVIVDQPAPEPPAASPVAPEPPAAAPTTEGRRVNRRFFGRGPKTPAVVVASPVVGITVQELLDRKPAARRKAQAPAGGSRLAPSPSEPRRLRSHSTATAPRRPTNAPSHEASPELPRSVPKIRRSRRRHAPKSIFGPE